MQSLRCFSSNLVNVRFPGKPSIQDYLQISGCFDPLDLPSEEPKAMGVRDAPPWRIEQHYHTLIWQRCLQQESYFSYPLHTFYCRYTIKFHPLPHIPVIICTHNKVTVSASPCINLESARWSVCFKLGFKMSAKEETSCDNNQTEN